ncbi:MAG: hypothetical protein ACLT5A_13375 [Clostridiaceae bacterium]
MISHQESHQHGRLDTVIDDGKIKAEGLKEDVLPCLNGPINAIHVQEKWGRA